MEVSILIRYLFKITQIDISYFSDNYQNYCIKFNGSKITVVQHCISNNRYPGQSQYELTIDEVDFTYNYVIYNNAFNPG